MRGMFLVARRLPPLQRTEYLDQACANPVDLRSEVAALLQ